MLFTRERNGEGWKNELTLRVAMLKGRERWKMAGVGIHTYIEMIHIYIRLLWFIAFGWVRLSRVELLQTSKMLQAKYIITCETSHKTSQNYEAKNRRWRQVLQGADTQIFNILEILAQAPFVEINRAGDNNKIT